MTALGDLSFLLFAGLIGGFVNVIASGAKLFLFPMLVAAGLPPLVANATATVGLWPAQLPGVWIYRKSIRKGLQGHVVDSVCAATGAITGAILLYLLGESVFLPLVPAFLAVAVVAILFGEHLSKLGLRMGARNTTAARALFLLIGAYAGYFGAGYGFLIMAAVFLAGESSVHVATARKNFISLAANTAAVVPLSLTGLVDWRAAIAVLIGGLVGGAIGGNALTVLPQRPLKWIIAAMGTILLLRFVLQR